VLIVLTFFIVKPVTAQFPSPHSFNQGPVVHSLILYNPDVIRDRQIKVGDSMCYKTGTIGNYICDKVRKISFDTIFFPKGYLRISDIKELKAMWHKNLEEYDLKKWVIVAPPREVFASAETFNAFKRWIEDNVNPDGSYNVNDWRSSDLYQNSINHVSRYRRSGPGVLNFQDTTTLSYYMIQARQFVRFTTNKDEQEHSGFITWIAYDTIFVKNQKFLAGDLKEITHSKLGSPSFKVYRSKIIVPPTDDYQSPIAKKIYTNEVHKMLEYDRSKINSDTIHKNFLKINFTRLPLLVLAVSYETKITRNVSFEVEVSGQLQMMNDTTSRDVIPYLYPLYRYSGITLIPGIKFYTNYSKYIEPIVVYRYLTMHWANSIFPQWNDDPVQSQFRNDIGVGVRFGKMRNFKGVVLDQYIGFGLQYISIHQLSYGVVNTDAKQISWFNSDHSPRIKDISFPYPLINLGLKVGFGW